MDMDIQVVEVFNKERRRSKTREDLFRLLGIRIEDVNWTTTSTHLQLWIQKLAPHFLNPEWTGIIAESFPSLVPVLMNRCWKGQELKVIMALSGLLGRFSSLERFSTKFFQEIGSPMKIFDSLNKPSKRPKLVSENETEFLTSVYLIMKLSPCYNNWDVRPFLERLKSRDEVVRWLSLHCLGLILHLSESELTRIKATCKISESVNITLSVQLQNQLETCTGKSGLNQLHFGAPLDEISHLLPNSESQLIAIGGLIVDSQSTSLSHVLCPLQSTIQILREIALCTLSKTPVCVFGPISSGKTFQLQLLASIFGRSHPQIVIVQLSDQIDSKLLLGSYHSTDLPGQFVWRAGVLTKAVLDGGWVVFEDLDSATDDVQSILSGIVDNGKVSVAGFGEVTVHDSFRMFATCRTQVGKRTDKIKTPWKKLIINPISMEELKILIHHLYPHLKSVSDRLIDMFQAVVELNSGSFGAERVVSLRDFLKFCRRVPATLDFTQPQSAILLFQEAFDIFVSSKKLPEKRQESAELIGTHLNLLKAKSEYFCSMYKPTVSICFDTNMVTCGRNSVKMFATSGFDGTHPPIFSLTKRASCLLEMIAGCVKHKEPILLTGETGVGKTSAVQYLAGILHQKLVVVNLNRQSDSGDLLGGYKPVELKYIFGPIREEFESLFNLTFNREANCKFLTHIMTCYGNRRWKDLLKLMLHVEKSAVCRTLNGDTDISRRWRELSSQLSRINVQIHQGESPFAFSFIEGSLIKAIKNGHWILLDEINLATPEMLQCLYGIVDEQSNINLWEKGDDSPVNRHANFQLFAAMNPATDVGKKDLPVGLRNRFTEFFLPDLSDPTELQTLVQDYLINLSLTSKQTESIVQFYTRIRAMSETSLVDGVGKKPHYSLRTLCRALRIGSLGLYGSVSRSLYESFCLSFLTQLDRKSHSTVEELIAMHIFGKADIKSILNQALPCPKVGKWVQIESYWLPAGEKEPRQLDKYILTNSIRKNLKDLARIVSAGKLPVLIQGDTSVGKTSLIQYLAEITGNDCYRINNHQHTDLQEYIGSYQSDPDGKLVFMEGVLIQSMRKGHWIILDELNLAPSEVLEALNRLLDDNRQLFIPETGQVINAHPRFMLFATQNPPGFYGGRKLLSRAFRNRFVELHFDEIPGPELEDILHQRCEISVGYCRKIVAVLKELQVLRKASAALEGKHGFATLRDLFRWAERYRKSAPQTTRFYDWDQHLADEGYLVIAGKVRKKSEAEVIRQVLKKHLKRDVEEYSLFSLHERTSSVTRSILEKILQANLPDFKHIVWTFQLRRLAVMVGKALQFCEPSLLVGETGCGKTTMVQLLSQLQEQKLFSVNCHMNSEGSDFIGGLRPVRERDQDGRLFEWVNGPLISAMETGSIFLVDEISLADDSVLERLNSVLEPERSILISEKGDETTLIKAHDNFHFVSTMNPGGDYGKKELSPALRNRLTEIWAEGTLEDDDLELIIEHNLNEDLKKLSIGKVMTSFCTWLRLGQRWTISIRDYLAWVRFVNHSVGSLKICVRLAIHHGACLVFLDGAGSLCGVESSTVCDLKSESLAKLAELTYRYSGDYDVQASFRVTNSSEEIRIGQFSLPKNTTSFQANSDFNLNAPTTSQNGLRLIRSMQLQKPILLEGSPGVGKTAIVSCMAKMAGYELVRINLSEQTDVSDLFGADLPIEGETGGNFAWRDGPLLQALKNSSWILLDELNLASQPVLEGLNACLDHRGEVYIPELNRTFNVKVGSKIIACQNPVRQGGARKSLPKSFLNRFTQVYMDPLDVDDLTFILSSLYPEIARTSIAFMATFSGSLAKAASTNLLGSRGSPWDFNLRDLVRWCSLISKKNPDPGLYLDLIYAMRMRTEKDSNRVRELYGDGIVKCGSSGFLLTNETFVCGNGEISRKNEIGFTKLIPLQRQLATLEGLTVCLEMGWMPILVGPSGSGKTSLMKFLAEMCGRTLQILTVSPEMDTMELLGGFEQADVYRKIDACTVSFRQLLLSIVQFILCQLGRMDMMDLRVLDLWEGLRGLEQLLPDADSSLKEANRIQQRLDYLRDVHSKCKSLLKQALNGEIRMLQQFELKLEDVGLELDSISAHLKNGIHTGGFQWVNSVLVEAIKNGYWLLIDGANTCSASVLDRLNPLLEPNGSLFLSERGCIDGNIQELKPHADFRLVLAMDPSSGEISRAMRNRGVELFMRGPDEVMEDEEDISKDSVGRILNSNNLCKVQDETKCWDLDLDSMLKSVGLHDPLLRTTLIHLHREISASFFGTESSPLRLVQTVESVFLRVEHGMGFADSMGSCLVELYVGNSQVESGKSTNEFSLALIRRFIGQIREDISVPRLPLSISNFVSSQMYRVWRNLELIFNALENPLAKNIQDDFPDLFVLSIFSNISRSDAGPLAKAIQLKLGKYSALAFSLGAAIPTQSDEYNPWDFQWCPKNMLVKSGSAEKLFETLQTHLLMSKVHFVKADSENPNSSTLAKSISQDKFTENTDFFTHFFALLKEFSQVLNSLCNTKGSKLHVEDFPVLWQRGISTFLWYRRTLAFTKQALETNKKERLMSNFNLLIRWIGEQVLPFLHDMEIGGQMALLISKCSNELDLEPNLVSSPDVRSFKDVCCTKPFFVMEKDKAELVQDIMETCLSLWSFPTKSDGLIFFNSKDGAQCHSTLCLMCTKIFSGGEFTEEDHISLSNIRACINNFNDSTKTPVRIQENSLKNSLSALKEYIRICYSEKSSTFVSPILVSHVFMQSPSFIKDYLQWEDVERFAGTFLSNGAQIQSNSGQLPYLVSDLLVENGSLRSSTLGSGQTNKSCMQEVSLILNTRMLADENNQPDKMSIPVVRENLKGLLIKITAGMGKDWEVEKVAEWNKMLADSDGDSKAIYLGSVMIQLGLTLMRLTSLPVVDPAVEKQILSGYLKEEISFLKSWICAQRIRTILDTGVDLLKCSKSQVHPYVLQAVLHLNKLENLLLETELEIAHRPNPPKYSFIRNEIGQFTKMYGMIERMKKLVCSVQNIYENSHNTDKIEEINSAFSQCQIWIDAHRNFSGKLSKCFWYWDVTAGFLFSSSLVSKGLSFFCDFLSQLRFDSSKGTHDYDLAFPIPFTQVGEINNLSKYQRCLKTEFITFLNEIETEKYLSNSIIAKLQKSTKEICLIWKRQERHIEKQKELEDAMYLYKGKEKTIELSEEEQNAMEIRETFPGFEFEYGGFLEQANSSNSNGEIQDQVLPNSGNLTPEVAGMFFKVHERAISMIKNHWIGSSLVEENIPDFVTPFISRFESTCLCLSQNYHIPDKAFESKFILGANLIVSQVGKSRSQSSKLYDFYHDPNVDEIQKLGPIFNGLRSRVNELLEEWPEHPSLLKILEILSRIEGFRIEASVMKFLTGLELLLGIAQEWETCAHSGVSISIYLHELTDVIISWRKLELHCWKDLLDVAFAREQSEACKWWFHLFSSASEAKSTESNLEFLKLLQQYIESSPIGQFQTRLNYVYNLHCYLIIQQNDSNLLSITWNIYNFYNQFKEVISSKINTLRIPIEKKLKDFVKICRWNDANFYSLKDSVLKSQKTLVKLVKEWRKVLLSPVRSFLIFDEMARKSAHFKPPKMILYLTPSNWRDQTQIGKSLVELRFKRLKKLPKLYSKMQSLAKDLLNFGKFTDEITNLDELNSTVIGTLRDLEGLKAPESDPPEKRKKTLRNIHLRKRTGLADLFKVLQELNLSYRRGLVQKNQYSFSIEPTDLPSGWKHIIETPIANKELTNAWTSCEDYFQRSISRITSMDKSFQSPSKELGPIIIDRCKGFVADLFYITIEQKASIAKFSRMLWEIRILTQVNGPGIRQSVYKQVYNGVCKIDYSTKQYLLLTDSVRDDEVRVKHARELEKVLSICDHIKYLIKGYVDQVNIVENVLIPDSEEVLEEGFEGIEKISGCYKRLEADSVLGKSIREIGVEIDNIKCGIDFGNVNSSSVNPKIRRRHEKELNNLLEKILLTFQNLHSNEHSNDEMNIKQTFQKEMNSFDIEKINEIIARIPSQKDPTIGLIYNGLIPLIKQYSMLAQFYLTIYVGFHRASCKLLCTLSGLFGSLAEKGFCLPSDYTEEAALEGPELDSQSGMGLGSGESSSDSKDVSDRIESEDQLEDTLKEGEEPDPANEDLNEEENGIEMPEDFEGSQQEKKNGKDDAESGEESEQENDLDKQMGEVGPEENKLDDQMWGGSSDEEEDELNPGDNQKGKTDQSEPELAAKDPSLENDSEEDNKENDNKNQQNQPKLNEENDEDPNDDQIDPYHGQNEPEEQPEPMDLPDDLNLDGEDKEKDGNPDADENPFDLDGEKEEPEMPEEMDEMANEDLPRDENEVQDDQDDVPEIEFKGPDADSDSETDSGDKVETEEIQEEPMETETEPEKTSTKDNNIEKTDDKPEPALERLASLDRTNPNPEPTSDEKANNQDPQEETPNKKDDTASGLVESHDGDGHQGKKVKEKSGSDSRNEKDFNRKPGKSDDSRSLANDSSEKTKNRLKTMQNTDEEIETIDLISEDESEQNADLFQHIKDPKKSDAQTIDSATKEQAEKNRNICELESNEEPELIELDEEMTEGEDVEIIEKTETQSTVTNSTKKPDEKERGSRMEAKMDTEGDPILTLGVKRPANSVIQTRFELLEEWSREQNTEILQEMDMVIESHDLGCLSQWHDLENRTLHLAQELCEQLRLILEPTKASRLKGDYKTGKRLNMRKVIPYIASGFRKDKIWLRRTQPSKREYQILLALDDSASMCDNQSKQMAFSAVAVLAKSLSLLEAGQLAVLSFGEDVKLLHGFDEPFTDHSGANLLSKFTFTQRRTRIAQLLSQTSAMFRKTQDIAQLLLIISDGRGVSNEGSDIVQKAVRRIRDQNIFVVFIIVDNPENKDSILDIRLPIFDGNGIVEIARYMDHFPFPFYLILRDLGALPSVLSDALRQWFELVAAGER